MRSKGFTLIELLVVIAMIAILSVIASTIFSGVQKNARDAVRQSDVQTIAKALESHYDSTAGTYPVLVASWFGSGTIPIPPEGGSYQISSLPATGFQICATLENTTTSCKESTQGRYVPSATPTPTPVPTPTPTPIPTPTPTPGPGSIANLKLWLKADSLGLSDGNIVSTWNDSSGSGNDAVTGVSGGEPIYKTNIINGKPVVRFTGPKYMKVNSFSSQFTAAASWFVVFNPQGDSSYTLFYTGGDQWDRYFGDNTSYPAAFKSTSRYSSYLTMPTSSSHQLSGVASSSYQLFLDGNGGAVQSGHDFGFQAQTELDIGGHAPNAGSIEGDIAEVVVYNRALTTVERQTIESYLRTKYSLP